MILYLLVEFLMAWVGGQSLKRWWSDESFGFIKKVFRWCVYALVFLHFNYVFTESTRGVEGDRMQRWWHCRRVGYGAQLHIYNGAAIGPICWESFRRKVERPLSVQCKRLIDVVKLLLGE